MSSNIFLTLGERTVMVSRPATYQDLVAQIRTQFPRVSSVYSLAVVYQPAVTNGGAPQNWVEIDSSAYSAVHDGAELFVNVVHPLTKEYILPLPARSVPNRQNRKQVRRTDGFGTRVGVEDGDLDATLQDDQVSKLRPRGASSGPRGISHNSFNSSLSLELERAGGDAFGNGWGGASERFRRSTKLVPNLKDCKEAIGQRVGESNFYPDDEEGQTADFKLGIQQNRPPQATEAGWFAGGETARGFETRGESEAQHLAGDFEEDQGQGKKTARFHPDEANHNWFAASHSPHDPVESLPPSPRGQPISTALRWGDAGRVGQQWGGYRTPSPSAWVPYHGRGNYVPQYVRSRSCSPTDVGAGNWGGGWDPQHSGMHVADQEYSRIDDGHTEAGHLTNGHQANGENTNGVLTNGDLTNGYPAAHLEVSPNPQHQVQHHGGSDWSPQRPQSNGYHQPQYPRIQGYQRYLQPNRKALAGSRPRRDPAEVTYGSPRPRIQGSATGWTTIGRKRNTWTNNLVQEESDREEGAPGPNADDNQAWYGTPPPLLNFNTATAHGGAFNHGGLAGNNTNDYQQKQRPGRQMSWGSDFWGGPPPNRIQRGALAQDDTPASKHWQ